jgi:hypothetical protein
MSAQDCMSIATQTNGKIKGEILDIYCICFCHLGQIRRPGALFLSSRTLSVTPYVFIGLSFS